MTTANDGGAPPRTIQTLLAPPPPVPAPPPGQQERDLSNPLMHVLCMGAGVDTTAMLLKWHDRYDAVLFADPGGEEPETYEHIEKRLKPFCREHNVPWVTVVAHRPDPDHPNAAAHAKAARAYTAKQNAAGVPYSLQEHCQTRQILPIIARRWCTVRFKINPINRWCRDAGATRERPIVKHIGIAHDEAWRLKSFGADDPLYVGCAYPLVDARMTRDDCLRIIADHGWPTTAKSGCDYCMFKKRHQFREMARSNPARFLEIVRMENNAMADGQPPLLKSGPLSWILEPPPRTDQSLDDLEKAEAAEAEESCTTGYCFG